MLLFAINRPSRAKLVPPKECEYVCSFGSMPYFLSTASEALAILGHFVPLCALVARQKTSRCIVSSDNNKGLRDGPIRFHQGIF